MSYSNEQKVVGQPCTFCGTPYEQGRNGAYCKPCYVKWKNGQGGNNPPKSYNSSPKPQTPRYEAPVASQTAVDWDKKSWGMCKYGFLIESYKMKETLEVAEKRAEAWATACMRGYRKPEPKPQIDPRFNFTPKAVEYVPTPEEPVNEEIRVEDIPL